MIHVNPTRWRILDSMGRLYGDSTPFPYDVDYLEIVRASVRASVRLLLAQQAIDDAMAAIARADAVRVADRARLERLGESVRQTVVRFDTDGREARVAQRVRDAARGAVDEEIGQIRGHLRHRTGREEGRGRARAGERGRGHRRFPASRRRCPAAPYA